LKRGKSGDTSFFYFYKEETKEEKGYSFHDLSDSGIG
jgi:hypothetical protein